MEYIDGNFVLSAEEIEALTTPDKEPELADLNPLRVKVIWAYLNSTHTAGKKPPLTASQYREMLRVLFGSLDADMRKRIEKYTIAFDLSSDYARGVGRGAFHYLAELYALKADIAIFSFLSVLESLQNAKEAGQPDGIDTLIKDGVLTEEEDGILKDCTGEDGRIFFTYGGKTKEDIKADMERAIKYLYSNLRGFRTDIEGMLKYIAELLPAPYLEPFGFNLENTLPLSLKNYIYRMEKGFIEEVGVDINETTAGKGKHKIYPTYRSIKINKSGVDAQYKAFKNIIEKRWRNG